VIILRTILALILISWCSVFGADNSSPPQTWIATNTVGANECSSNYFGEYDLTPSVTTNVPNPSAYSSSSVRLLLRNREAVLTRALASGTFGGKLMANYDVRSVGSVNTVGMTQNELYRVWQTNQTLFKTSYYRGRVFYTDRNSFSDEWITVFSSEDKRRIVFARDSGPIFFSENTGASWRNINQPGQYEFTLSTTPKGTVMVAALSFTNSSTANIADEKMATKNWYSVVSAADGSKLVLTGGPSQSTPVLSIANSGNIMLISWSATFTGFILQQNSDLTTTNWANVTNTVDRVETQFVVTLPVAGSNNFFRLKTP
jgi:hypothetical protein